MRIGKNTPWLVKTSSGRVIGPFFDKELISRLRTREITLIDEISRPCGRWIYIRDEPSFASVAEEMRQKNGRPGGGDDTTTRAELTMTSSQTLSLTDSVDPLMDDHTEEISNVVYTEPVREVIQRPTAKVTDETFVFEGDRTVRAQTSGSTAWLWVATVLVLFSAIGFVTFRQYISKPIRTRIVAKQGFEEAEKAYASGDYVRALALYKRAYDAFPTESKIFLPYSLLSIQLENQTVLPRRLLEALLASQERDREKILTALALAYISEGKFSDADARLARALDVNTNFRPAMINLGVLGLATQDYEKANNHLQLVVKDGSRDGIEFLLLAQVLIALYERDKDKDYLDEADRFLSQYLASKQDYLPEMLVASIYVDHLRQDRSKIMQKINRFLDTDPQQTDLHRRDLYIYRRNISWDILNQWCLKTTENMDPVAKIVAFEAMCLLKANDLKEANRKVADAAQQSPRDPAVQAAYGYIMSESNLEDKAKAAYARALDFDREKTLVLPRLLMARACEKEGNIGCANLYWSELAGMNHVTIVTLVARAAHAFDRGNKDEARRLLQKGLNISPNYKPLLRLQEEIR